MSQPAHAVSDLLLVEGGVSGIHDRLVDGFFPWYNAEHHHAGLGLL